MQTYRVVMEGPQGTLTQMPTADNEAMACEMAKQLTWFGEGSLEIVSCELMLDEPLDELCEGARPELTEAMRRIYGDMVPGHAVKRVRGLAAQSRR